jgi:ferrous iron transport protein B
MFISLLEDSGYMARAAFIMDRLMHRIGLHGKSFIPMIMGFGCNVPAIMATRTIESRKSRLITMLIIPLMSCAGRMPVYILIAGAFFPKHAGLVLLGMYALGILVAIVAAKIFSHFFKEDDLPFVMELPPYRVPTAKSIFRHTWEKGKQYLQKMSGIILICSMVIWFLGYFPNHHKYETAQQQQEHSFIGYVGKAMEPALKPLGFDWKMGVGIVAGVGAKELVVSTLGVMYADDEPVAAESVDETRLQRALVKSVTPAGALAYMVFILLYFPCIATFVAIRNESGGWKWAILTAIYTIILAWIMAFATFQIASLFFSSF